MPQSLSNLLAHLVFSTAHRDRHLAPEVREELFPYLAGILKKNGCHVIQIGGVHDHVHILFALSRTVAMADAVKAVKGGTSGWIKDRWAIVDFAWQAGYGSFSVGRREVEAEVRYIQDQEAHHRKRTFQDEYRELMTLARLEVDERYAWD